MSSIVHLLTIKTNYNLGYIQTYTTTTTTTKKTYLIEKYMVENLSTVSINWQALVKPPAFPHHQVVYPPPIQITPKVENIHPRQGFFPSHLSSMQARQNALHRSLEFLQPIHYLLLFALQSFHLVYSLITNTQSLRPSPKLLLQIRNLIRNPMNLLLTLSYRLSLQNLSNARRKHGSQPVGEI